MGTAAGSPAGPGRYVPASVRCRGRIQPSRAEARGIRRYLEEEVVLQAAGDAKSVFTQKKLSHLRLEGGIENGYPLISNSFFVFFFLKF